MFDLDFSLLPRFAYHRVFKGLPNWVEEPLSELRMPETLDRLKGASMFLGEVSATESVWANRAYLRAGLSEFRSVAQALHWDLGRRQVHSPEKSRNPLIHLLFRLRRLAVYVANAGTREEQVTATIRLLDDEHSAEIRVLLIENIEGYLRRENLSEYRDEDISRVCEWFNVHQSVYGASQLLDAGVVIYAEEICDIYSDRRVTA